MTETTAKTPRTLTLAELACLVKVFRGLRSWSQEQLADISRLSTRTVQRVEDGQPSFPDTRRALASAFGFEDIDALNKPFDIPTPEELKAEKGKFDREHVTLALERIESGKQLGKLAQARHAAHFSEAVELKVAAGELFVNLTDYCREYGDCYDLYSEADKLGVYEELDTYVKGLLHEGIRLGGAVHSANLKSAGVPDGMRMDLLYVVAFPKDCVPEKISVPRQVRFG